MNVVLPATHINTLQYLRRFNLTLNDLSNQPNQPNASAGVRHTKTDLWLENLIFKIISHKNIVHSN